MLIVDILWWVEIHSDTSFLPSSHSSKTHFVYIRKKYCFDKTDHCNYSKKSKMPKIRTKKLKVELGFLFVCLLLLLTRLDSSWINKTLVGWRRIWQLSLIGRSHAMAIKSVCKISTILVFLFLIVAYSHFVRLQN